MRAICRSRNNRVGESERERRERKGERKKERVRKREREETVGARDRERQRKKRPEKGGDDYSVVCRLTLFTKLSICI